MKYIAVVFFGFLLASCQSPMGSTSENNDSSESNDLSVNLSSETPSLPVRCSKPPLVDDIWKLEPMLIKKGEIEATMSREEKEVIIRQYIRNKNEKFRQCSKGKS